LGRMLTAADDRVGAEPVALLSDLLWRRRFGADAGVLGRSIKVNGVSHTIVGVMPEGFRFPEFAQVWAPLAPARQDQKRGDRSLGVVARLKPGVDAAAAGRELRAIAAAISAEHPETN